MWYLLGGRSAALLLLLLLPWWRRNMVVLWVTLVHLLGHHVLLLQITREIF